MRQTDVHILEHLYNEGRELIDRPTDIGANIDFTVGTVQQRMPKLREVGFVEYYDADRGQYQISDLGKRYLSGELTDDEIERLEDEL